MSRLHPATRRQTLRMLAAAPYLLLPRSVLAAPSRRWSITGMRVEKLDSLDAAMQRLLQRYAVRAGSLAVARQGKLLFARGYTWAEPDYPVTQADSPFRLASVSKAFTAAVIYQLLQAKKLELSLPVFPWLGLDRAALAGQTVDPRLATITVQQLINHRGGWDSRAANFDPVFSMRRIARRLGLRSAPSSRDIARFMVGEPLQFAPGTQEHYSNFGYVMLGLVAEKAGASAFHDLVRDQVAVPLGIDRVFRARTRRDQRLPGEGFYDQPGTGLTPEFPDREVRVPLPYGGEGWLTESMNAGGRLAASAGAVARMIGHYAVWGLGLRRANQNWARSGAMAGTSSLAISRPDGLDLCFVANTRNFGGAKAMTEASNDIKRVLDSMPPAESSTTR
jgi:CubicO group peptidase (beta-lactamase class C family)